MACCVSASRDLTFRSVVAISPFPRPNDGISPSDPEPCVIGRLVNGLVRKIFNLSLALLDFITSSPQLYNYNITATFSTAIYYTASSRLLHHPDMIL
jgi:hypothetical protein